MFSISSRELKKHLLKLIIFQKSYDCLEPKSTALVIYFVYKLGITKTSYIFNDGKYLQKICYKKKVQLSQVELTNKNDDDYCFNLMSKEASFWQQEKTNRKAINMRPLLRVIYSRCKRNHIMDELPVLLY